MKKILALMLMLCAVFAGAQVPTTPNIRLYIPLHNTPLWDNYMNPNFSMLDNFLSGHATLPRINLGQLGITQYVDYTGTTAPALPAAGFCRTYYDLASNQWTGLNSAGELCSSQNAVGSTGHVGYYASTGRKISPDACTTDGSGNHTCASYTTNGIGTAKIDFPEGTSPGNPSAGFQRVFASSVDHVYHCLTPTGGNCFPFAASLSPTFTGTVTMPDGSTWGNLGTVTPNTQDFFMRTGSIVALEIDGISDGLSPNTLTKLASVGTVPANDAAYLLLYGNTPNNPQCAGQTAPTHGGWQLLVQNGSSVGLCGDVTGIFAPTRSVDDNTKHLATTDFVLGQAASATPVIDGTATPGTSTRYARADHVHPTDTTRAPLANPNFTGTVTAPLYATTTNCANSGGTCAAASAGRVSIAAAATTVTVSTTAVTANSEIFIQEDSTLGTALSVTCNTVTGRTYSITTRTAGTSFVVTASAAPTTNPACLNFKVIN